VDKDKHDVKQITAKFSDRCSEVMKTIMQQTGSQRNFQPKAVQNLKNFFNSTGGLKEHDEEDDVASQLSNLLKRKNTTA
jgi:hypothetical protein